MFFACNREDVRGTRGEEGDEESFGGDDDDDDEREREHGESARGVDESRA